MESSQLFEVFKSYGEQLPSFLALLAGIVFALSRWKQYPKVAMLVVIGLVVLLLHQLIFTIVFVFSPSWFIPSASWFIPSDSGPEDIRTVVDRLYLVLRLLSNGVAATGFGVLLAAVFMRRTPEPVAET